MFLVALLAVFTLWSQVGGQYHLDLMYWPWKLGIGLAAAALITLMAASPRRLRVWAALLVLVVLIAAAVTHYYHINEPDEQDDGDAQTQLTTSWTRTRAADGCVPGMGRI